MGKIICCFCGKEVEKTTGAINRANKNNLPMFCDRKCSSANKKTSKEDKIELKRLYDLGYRKRPDHKQKKSESFQRNYDPVKAAAKRKETMWRHVEYCRQPEYKLKKKEYDRIYRAKLKYGELWEVAILTMKIQDEVLSRMTRYKIDLESNTLNKSQRRKRHERQINSEKLKECPLGHIDQR
jgi:ribosomal protein L24E